MSVKIERKTCRAADGVEIVYSAAGKGEPALVFIHGGLANRGFWDGQLRAFGGRSPDDRPRPSRPRRVGLDRTKWGIPNSARTSRPSSTPRRSKKVIIFGNSLGGPVAVEAALLLPGRVLGVVGVDTFQLLERSDPARRGAAEGRVFREGLSRRLEGDGRHALPQGRRPGRRRRRREAHGRDPSRGGQGDVPRHGGIRLGAAAAPPDRAPPGHQRRPLSDRRRSEPEDQARFRRRHHEAHGPLPHARAAGRVQPPRGGDGRRVTRSALQARRDRGPHPLHELGHRLRGGAGDGDRLVEERSGRAPCGCARSLAASAHRSP